MLRVKRAPLWHILSAAAMLLLLLAFTLSCSALGVPNSSAEHGTYEAADLNAAKETLADGQKLQDLLHWAISARPKQLSLHEEQKWVLLVLTGDILACLEDAARTVLANYLCAKQRICYEMVQDGPVLSAAHSDADKLKKSAERGDNVQQVCSTLCTSLSAVLPRVDADPCLTLCSSSITSSNSPRR